MMGTSASVHDSAFFKILTSECLHLRVKELLGDRSYIGQATQLRLFEELDLTLSIPYRRKKKDFVKYDFRKLSEKRLKYVSHNL